MKLLNIFKKKNKVITPLYKTNFRTWVLNATDEEIEKYIKTIDINGKEYDYTKKKWGHSFNYTKEIGKYIYYGSGFYSGVNRPIIGNVLLMKTTVGIGRFIVLNIEWENDPQDMFWAYIIGIGDK